MAPQVLFCFLFFFGLRKKKTSMRLRIDKKKGVLNLVGTLNLFLSP